MQRAVIRNAKRFTRQLKVEGLEARRVLAAAVELPGDWDGQSFSTIATYDADDGTFTVHANEGAGTPEMTYRFGPRNSRMTPFFGDWDGDGTPTAGLYSRATGKFFLKNDLATMPADVVFKFGPQDKQWAPFAGDWDGDGIDGVGLYEPGTGKFFLKNEADSGKADSKFQFGTVDPNWQPVAGDWNEDGKDNVGVLDAGSGESLLRDGDALPGPAGSEITFESLNLIWQPTTPTEQPNPGTAVPLDFEQVQADLDDSLLISLAESSEDVVPDGGEPFPPPFTINLTEAEAAALLARVAEQEAQAANTTSATTEADETSDETEVGTLNSSSEELVAEDEVDGTSDEAKDVKDQATAPDHQGEDNGVELLARVTTEETEGDTPSEPIELIETEPETVVVEPPKDEDTLI